MRSLFMATFTTLWIHFVKWAKNSDTLTQVWLILQKFRSHLKIPGARRWLYESESHWELMNIRHNHPSLVTWVTWCQGFVHPNPCLGMNWIFYEVFLLFSVHLLLHMMYGKNTGEIICIQNQSSYCVLNYMLPACRPDFPEFSPTT
jgi:hypothetical protein